MSGSIKTETKQKDVSPPIATQVANEIVKRNAKRKSKKKEDLPLTPSQIARERVKRYLIPRFYTRFHMSLILVTAGLVAMLTTWFLLRIGIHVMWVRYPVAISFAYVAFLAGIWLWLHYVNFTQTPRKKHRCRSQAFWQLRWLLRSMSP